MHCRESLPRDLRSFLLIPEGQQKEPLEAVEADSALQENLNGMTGPAGCLANAIEEKPTMSAEPVSALKKEMELSD